MRFGISALALVFVSACLIIPVINPTPSLPPPTAIATQTSVPQSTLTATATSTPIPPTATLAPPTQTPIPTPTPPPVVRFAVIGDYGKAGEREADVANLITSWQPDFIITTGDNNYPNGAAETIDENIGQYYHQYIFPYVGDYGPGAKINRFFPTLGNHDWITDRAQPYFDYFTLPGNERYYDFTWGMIHFFALDSDSREPDGVGMSSIQGNWLMGNLANSTSVWKIVYMHHPPYSSAHHGSIDWMQWPFKEWGATIVISGHDHVYERLIIDDFPYIINGVGGSPDIYWFSTTIEGSQVRFREDSGAMLVTASDQEINFQFITRKGEVIDSYTIYADGQSEQ